MMRVIVCMKQVLDPEAPASSFQVNPEAKRVIPPKGTPPVLSPFDENALEAALKIKDTQGAEIIVISMGRDLAKPVVRKSLAAGADELILLEDATFDDLDSCATAHVLTAAIKMVREYDLILCGRQAADTDAGQVGSGIAEILGIPSITVARKIEASNGMIKVERVVSNSYEVIMAPLPALVTASNELGELRSATMKAIMEAQKKPTTILNAQELGVNSSRMKRTNLLRLLAPTRQETECEFVADESLEGAGANLALKLREAEMI